MAENAANVNLKPVGAFFHAIYIQGNPENVPNLNLKKTHLRARVRVCVHT